MDFHDWKVARNTELRQAATIEDPQARIDAVNDIVERYADMKHPNWVISQMLPARIKLRARAEKGGWNERRFD